MVSGERVKAERGQYFLVADGVDGAEDVAALPFRSFYGRFGIEVHPDLVRVSCIGEDDGSSVLLSIDVLEAEPAEVEGARAATDAWDAWATTLWTTTAPAVVLTGGLDVHAPLLERAGTYRLALLARRRHPDEDEEHLLVVWPEHGGPAPDVSYPRPLRPGRLLALATSALVGLWFVAAELAFWGFMVGVLLLWGCGLAVAAFLTPPEPLAARSALAKRGFWLLKGVWGALMVGATAVYGAIVAVDLQRYDAYGDAFMGASRDLALFPPGLALILVWVASMWLALDFHRCRAVGRREAVDRLLRRAGPSLPARSRLRAWLTDLLMGVSDPVVAGSFAYLALPAVLFLVIVVRTAGGSPPG